MRLRTATIENATTCPIALNWSGTLVWLAKVTVTGAPPGPPLAFPFCGPVADFCEHPNSRHSPSNSAQPLSLLFLMRLGKPHLYFDYYIVTQNWKKDSPAGDVRTNDQ